MSALLGSSLALFVLPAVLGRVLLTRDIASNQVPWRATWARALERGELPLWDPGSSQGRHLLANPNAGAAYPGTALFLLLSPEHAAACHSVVHIGLFLLGCYRLCRRSGADRGAAALGAAAGLAGVAFSMMTFTNSLASLAWAPWAVARALKEPGDTRGALARGLGAGSLLGLSFLAGEPMVAALAALAFVVVVLWEWPHPRGAWGVAAAAVAAAALAAPVLVPLITALPDTLRGTLGTVPGALAADTLRPQRLPELLFPHLLGSPFGTADGGFWAARSFPWSRYFPLVFLGSMSVFTLSGLPGRTPRNRPWLVLYAVGFGLSLALAVPQIERWLRVLPPFSMLRFGIKLLILPALATPVLVAAGWESLRAFPARTRRRAAITLCLLACTLPAAFLPDRVVRPVLSRLYPASVASLAAVDSATMRTGLLADLLGLALPLAPLALAGPEPILAVLATMTGNTVEAESVLLYEPATRWAEPPALARLLPAHARLAVLVDRAMPADRPEHEALADFWRGRAALVPDFGGRWGYTYVLAHGPDGLEPFRQEAMAAAAGHLEVTGQARVAAALGADVVVASGALAGFECTPVDGVFACRPPMVAAPAYLATRALSARGAEATALTLASEEFRPGRDVVLEGTGGAESMAGGRLLSTGGPPHHRRLEVVCDGPGLLVVGQSFVHGWRATLDGQPVPVLAVNGCQLGIRAGAGRHDVEFYLDLAPYWSGLLGPLLLLGLALILRRTAPRGSVWSHASSRAGSYSPGGGSISGPDRRHV